MQKQKRRSGAEPSSSGPRKRSDKPPARQFAPREENVYHNSDPSKKTGIVDRGRINHEERAAAQPGPAILACACTLHCEKSGEGGKSHVGVRTEVERVVICSNSPQPPYPAEEPSHATQSDIRWKPRRQN